MHMCKKTRQAAEGIGLRFLPHPPSSSCLNPIGHLWNLLKRRLAALRPRPLTPDALHVAAIVIWDEFDQEMIDRLIMSMPTKIAAVIESEGSWSPY